MKIRQSQDHPLEDVRFARRGVDALNAGLEVVSSPAALWLRLGVALMLGSALAGLGLVVAFRMIVAARTGALTAFGGLLAPIVGGTACLGLGAIVFTAGWTTFKAYRRLGLI